MENLEGKTFGKLKVIKYIGKHYKFNYDMYGCICECGNIKMASSHNLVNNKTKTCGCGRRNAAKKATPPKNLTGQKFGRLNILSKVIIKKTYSSGVTKNTSYYYAWCDCQKDLPFEEREIRLYRQSQLLRGITKSCGCLHKEVSSQKSTKDISNQRFGNLTAIKLLENKRSNKGNRIWECKCDCGNIVQLPSGVLTSGNTKTCGRCHINGSLGENKIRNILNENGIIFEEQKTYNDLYVLDCYHKLKYDFYVDNKYIIEYDGEQHYKDVINWNKRSSYKQRQLYDYIKNRYCFDHNIPIIRIPYWVYDTICLDDLVLTDKNKYLLKDVDKNDEFEKFYSDLFYNSASERSIDV